MKTYLLIYGYEHYDYDIKTVAEDWQIGDCLRDKPPLAIVEITKEMLEELKGKSE